MILAKVTGPLMSIGASGKFLGFISYKWNGLDVMRPYISSNPSNTERQKENRDLFGAGSKYYKLLTDYDRKAWNQMAGKGLTGHNILTKLARNSIKETGNFALVYDVYIDKLVPGKARINFIITANIDLKLTVTNNKNNFEKNYTLAAKKNELNSFTISGLDFETKYSFIFKTELDIEKTPGRLVQVNANVIGDYYINYGLICTSNEEKDKLIKYKVELAKNIIDENNPIKLKYIGSKVFNKYYLYRLNNNLGLQEGLISKIIPPRIEFTDSGGSAADKMPDINNNEKLITGYSGLYNFESF